MGKIIHPKPDNFYRCWCKEQVLYQKRSKVVDGKLHLWAMVCRPIKEK